MKKIFALVTVICLSLVAFSCISCSKNDDPADNDLFVGTYKRPFHHQVQFFRLLSDRINL